MRYKSATLVYERTNETLRIRVSGMTNHELREVLVGCWAALDSEDRADHIKELQHYSRPDSFRSDVANAVCAAVTGKVH